MPIKILMPALSPTMTEGNLARWLKKEGDEVRPGDVIAEIETDKATMEVEAVDEGRLGKIMVDEGAQGVKVNDVIALLLEEGESPSDLAKANGKPAEAPSPRAAAPNAQPAPSHQDKKIPSAPAISVSGGSARIFASPLARRMAAQAGIDLTSIKGSGPHGRIVRADILKAPAGGAAVKPAQPAMSGGFGEAEYTLQPHSTMRKVIARRLTESKQQVPHFYLSLDCALDRLLALRSELNARAPEGADGYKLSVNDFIIRASALALKQVPAANASWSEEGVRLYRTADISVAVAIPNGLITPIIRAAEEKRLPVISREMKDLAERAKAGKLKPEEFTGGTFSLSNLGMFGISTFSAIINPPQGCILAVGAGEQKPVVREGKIEIATIMTVTLSVDHRVVDGAIGAQFLGAFKRLIEDPLSLVI
ncbi:MAG TPA: pyruvate dehydrogenase complex dihydrolipoamide acetyltransferase [Dongiaceae bacterium]|jgi:pyruvate dehydrogenase E2 component (dihydrolipoamide acetyltransferase)|nr:pyruvate dehydrogenase complex dihydrolipoamide acetyltransferase [Dongiaceae bacterium]